MKKAEHQMLASDHKITRTDYYQIFISVVMVILGVVISFRSLTETVNIMPLLVGGGFLALGCYRLNFVIKYLREKRKWNRR